MSCEILTLTDAFTIRRGSWFLVQIHNFFPQVKYALSKLDMIY